MGHRTPIGRRILMNHSREIDVSQDHLAISLSDTVFGFLQQGWEELYSPHCHVDSHDDPQDQDTEYSVTEERDKNFWESQRRILHGTLHRTTCLETRIRSITKKALIESNKITCSCRRLIFGKSCQNCTMRNICDELQSDGLNSAICKCKWPSSPDIPSGEHTFLDVMDSSNRKKGDVRVIIELNLRGEFELVRASEEYNELVSILPEVFIGKVERLVAIIKIVCNAAKKCMKAKNMHIGPWRKNGYMEAKWLKVSERSESKKRPLITGLSTRTSLRPKSSMLTIDLSENLTNLQCAAVRVA